MPKDNPILSKKPVAFVDALTVLRGSLFSFPVPFGMDRKVDPFLGIGTRETYST